MTINNCKSDILFRINTLSDALASLQFWLPDQGEEWADGRLAQEGVPKNICFDLYLCVVVNVKLIRMGEPTFC